MIKVVLDVTKTLEQNAASYFEKAKKSKAKLEGAKKALQKSYEKLAQHQKSRPLQEITQKRILGAPRKWYHKFRWFLTSDGYLAVGGRDADTNELLIKKHLEDGDLVFHTDMPGSPFFLLKAKTQGEAKDKQGSEFTLTAKQETASACATFSKAWGRGIGATEVYCIGHDKVKKDLGLPKGSFLILGKREYFTAALDLSVGITPQGEAMAGPKNAISAYCERYFILTFGDKKSSDIAKIVKKHLAGDLDDIIRSLPGGTFKITPSWTIAQKKP